MSSETFRTNGYRYIEEATEHGLTAVRASREDLETHGSQVQAEIRAAMGAPLSACMTVLRRDHIVIYPPSAP